MADINIVFARVDNRLVHGQVGMVWANLSGANLILVVDDEAANDQIQQQLMKMTLSATGLGIRFWTVGKTIADIWKASPQQKIFIVTKTPKEMRRLVEADIPIKKVNLGNMHSSPGKHKYKAAHIYVDDQDIEDLRAIKDRGVVLSIQVLPEYKEQSFD